MLRDRKLRKGPIMDVQFVVAALKHVKTQQRFWTTRATHVALAMIIGVLIINRPAVAQAVPETAAAAGNAW